METSICLRWEVPAHRSPLLHGEDQEFRIEANRFPVSNNQTQIPSDGKKKKKNTLTILQIKVENKINRHWQTEQWFTPAAQHSNIQIQFPDHLPQSDKHTKLQIAILANNDHSTSEQRVAPPVFKGYYTGYVLESHAVHLFISLIRFNTDWLNPKTTKRRSVYYGNILLARFAEILEWQTAVNFSKCTTDVAQLLTGSANDH